jgi:16S rRNA (cytidine1402-2'-O)-methyltransferase
MSTLYLVATPIGNLEDISRRALRVLQEVRRIAAEDTRRTAKLLSHYDIHTPLISFHEHSQKSKLASLLAELETGDLALVSDAGTPLLNDPGAGLVGAALAAGHQVCPIPGPSAPLAALIASGLPAGAFLYLGYLPRMSGERRRLLVEIAGLPYTLIFLETPHRLLAALGDLEEVLGNRPIAVARELTKIHEEILRGTISQARAHFSQQAPRGEFTLVVAGAPPKQKESWTIEEIQAAVQERISLDIPPAQIASQLAIESGWPRRRIYRLITELER